MIRYITWKESNDQVSILDRQKSLITIGIRRNEVMEATNTKQRDSLKIVALNIN